jgi:hypothetical protein
VHIGRLLLRQRSQNLCPTTATLRESVSHREESTGPKPEPLEEHCGSAHARASEPAKELLTTVHDHQQPEHQPRDQQAGIHGVFPPSDQVCTSIRFIGKRSRRFLELVMTVAPASKGGTEVGINLSLLRDRPAAADARA